MSKKIAFIGAGSMGFTRGLVRDLLTFPAFADAEIWLMDINKERLKWVKLAVDKIIKAGNYPAKSIATLSRKEALKGADGVLCTILSGDVDIWKYDITIPEKYGVDINVGDTRGPSGIFRAARTIPVLLDICKDIERYCPNAVFLNYTNPMAMNCKAMQMIFPKLKITGLCHSVQGTAHELAKRINAPVEEITYFTAGINHQAWMLRFEWNGKDAYPLYRKAIKKPEIWKKDIVRNEMFRHLDYFVTESSGHNSEYVAWFRKRKDLLKKYCSGGTSWNDGAHAMILKAYTKRKHIWKRDIKKWIATGKVDLPRGQEYACYIFNAIFGDNTPFEFNGNVINNGSITNLPKETCVEIPVWTSKRGFDPVFVGDLPEHLAILNNISARCENLAVEGAIEGDPRKIFHAVLFDPLTSAVLSMQETQDMVDEMFKASKNYLPQFKKFK